MPSHTGLSPLFLQEGSAADEAILQALSAGLEPFEPARPEAASAQSALGLPNCAQPLQVVRGLVLQRLERLRKWFPGAGEDELQAALLTYSPESALFHKGHVSEQKIADGHWKKFQGQLHYGSKKVFALLDCKRLVLTHILVHLLLFQNFMDGVKPILGEDIPEDDLMAAMVKEIMQQGKLEDRYNLWYVQYCAAVEQPNYDAAGMVRESSSTTNLPDRKPKVLDEGHGGKRLRDFTSEINAKLAEHGESERVTDARVLGLRLYTSSTFRQLNTALRDKGEGKTVGDMQFRACAQSARRCLLTMMRYPASDTPTFRGVTGFLPDHFKKDEKMGMDFAFFSTSRDESVADEFAGEEELRHVIFEVAHTAACPGVELSLLSLYPGEREIVYPPCTGLSLMDSHSASEGSSSGASAGQERVVITTATAR